MKMIIYSKHELVESIRKMSVVANNSKTSRTTIDNLNKAISKANYLLRDVESNEISNDIINSIDTLRWNNQNPELSDLTAEQIESIKSVRLMLADIHPNIKIGEVVFRSFATSNSAFIHYSIPDVDKSINIDSETIARCVEILKRSNSYQTGSYIRYLKFYLNTVYIDMILVSYENWYVANDGGPGADYHFFEPGINASSRQYPTNRFWKSAFLSESEEVGIFEIQSKYLTKEKSKHHLIQVLPNGTLVNIDSVFKSINDRYTFISSLTIEEIVE